MPTGTLSGWRAENVSSDRLHGHGVGNSHKDGVPSDCHWAGYPALGLCRGVAGGAGKERLETTLQMEAEALMGEFMFMVGVIFVVVGVHGIVKSYRDGVRLQRVMRRAMSIRISKDGRRSGP